jgi:hypothetical protein
VQLRATAGFFQDLLSKSLSKPLAIADPGLRSMDAPAKSVGHVLGHKVVGHLQFPSPMAVRAE